LSVPFYVAPEQLVRDKAEFARKGIARGRSIIAIEFDGGILLLAENISRALQKISEVYDRIAFAGVGRYNEFETLRKAGIRQADLMGYLYSRADVTAISQTLGQIFSHEPKPFEVEVLICEVGSDPDGNRLYKVTYDGTLYDQRGVVAIGGKGEALEQALRSGFSDGMSLPDAVALGVNAFRETEGRESEGWEAAVLDRGNGRRTFRRLSPDDLVTPVT
jgi:proteasome alpha subunit